MGWSSTLRGAELGPEATHVWLGEQKNRPNLWGHFFEGWGRMKKCSSLIGRLCVQQEAEFSGVSERGVRASRLAGDQSEILPMVMLMVSVWVLRGACGFLATGATLW